MIPLAGNLQRLVKSLLSRQRNRDSNSEPKQGQDHALHELRNEASPGDLGLIPLLMRQIRQHYLRFRLAQCSALPRLCGDIISVLPISVYQLSQGIFELPALYSLGIALFQNIGKICLLCANSCFQIFFSGLLLHNLFCNRFTTVLQSARFICDVGLLLRKLLFYAYLLFA